MRGIELLSVDFSKYERVMINSVIIRGLKIVAEKGYSGYISLLGFIDENLIFTTHYDKDDEIKFEESEGNFLSIRKK